MQNLNVVVVQADLIWEDPNENLRLMENLLKKVSGCDLVVLPEMFLTGFSMRPEILADEVSTLSLQWMKQTAARLNAAVTGSMMLEEDGRYYNALAFVTPEGDISWYKKRHLFSPGHESLHYSPGKERLIAEFRGWRICPLICYDLRFPVYSRNDCNYDLLIYVANWPEARNYAWQQLLRARAIENQCYVVACNRVGRDGNGVEHAGNSCIVNYMGEDIGFGNEQGVYQFNLVAEPLKTHRQSFPVLLDRDGFTLNDV